MQPHPTRGGRGSHLDRHRPATTPIGDLDAEVVFVLVDGEREAALGVAQGIGRQLAHDDEDGVELIVLAAEDTLGEPPRLEELCELVIEVASHIRYLGVVTPPPPPTRPS